MYTFESKEVTTLKDIKNETKGIKEEIAKAVGLDRDEFVLPNGLITLRGYSKNTDSWVNLTNVIGKFPEYIKSDSYSEYKLHCSIEVQK